jgi:hypothetical protein
MTDMLWDHNAVSLSSCIGLKQLCTCIPALQAREEYDDEDDEEEEEEEDDEAELAALEAEEALRGRSSSRPRRQVRL